LQEGHGISRIENHIDAEHTRISRTY
jgi:hypothetical protein